MEEGLREEAVEKGQAPSAMEELTESWASSREENRLPRLGGEGRGEGELFFLLNSSGLGPGETVRLSKINFGERAV